MGIEKIQQFLNICYENQENSSGDLFLAMIQMFSENKGMIVDVVNDSFNLQNVIENSDTYNHHYMNINLKKLESNPRITHTYFDMQEEVSMQPIFDKMFVETDEPDNTTDNIPDNTQKLQEQYMFENKEKKIRYVEADDKRDKERQHKREEEKKKETENVSDTDDEADSKTDDKADSKTNDKTDSKTDDKADSKTNDKTDSKTDDKADSKTDDIFSYLNTNTIPDTVPNTIPDTAPNTKPEPNEDPEDYFNIKKIGDIHINDIIAEDVDPDTYFKTD
jgi:hypothetical protein